MVVCRSFFPPLQWYLVALILAAKGGYVSASLTVWRQDWNIFGILLAVFQARRTLVTLAAFVITSLPESTYVRMAEAGVDLCVDGLSTFSAVPLQVRSFYIGKTYRQVQGNR